ncbi:site-specific integrase [Halorubrum ezzemoulense]|uniref:tyrosine-type recombinase/integrase n=1 Tax=Halorubrum ezzemoulense TaxID=337243 RepID=UPI00232C6424|nr:site-specific integrase [Halorubrum ezzemoulense]MDB9301257.1 site-specific integrase [Halorubrum ezzemoulense]
MRRATQRDSPDLKIEEAIEKFVARNRPDWKGETERTYRKSLDTFETFAEEAEIDTLDDIDLWSVVDYTDFLLGRDYAKITIQSKQKQTRRWIKWLEGQGLVNVGTHLAIEPLKLEDSEQTSSDTLEPEDIKSYLVYYREAPQWRATRRHALLEVAGHVAPRRGGIRALDVRDWDSEARTLSFRNRPETGTRLKKGDQHERKVVLAPEPAQILDEFVAKHRLRKHDEHGRSPLFASRQGRPTKSTITNWIYQATLPCVKQQCPHSREPHKCEWAAKQTMASQCPSSSSPHPIRRGSITWQLNLGRDLEDVAERAATTPDVLRRYYDRPDLDAALRRRITDFEGIDITEHSDPTDIGDEINDEEDQ